MEQPHQVQSTVEPTAQEVDRLEWKGEEAPYEFIDGVYYTKGIESGFMSLDTLRRAWREMVRAKKIAEAKTELRKLTRQDNKASEFTKTKIKNKAIKDIHEWQTAK